VPEILFLLGEAALARNDNHVRLPEAFAQAGWQVTALPHDCLGVHAGRIHLDGHDPDRFDRIWPLGLGPRETFFDRMQMLAALDQRRLVIGADAFTYLHGKYRWLDLMPETHAANDADALARVIASGGDWVIKPPAGSYGQGVQVIREGEDPMPALRSLTGGEARRYCLVQRYVPEIVRGEKRTLVAGGEVCGTYLRTPTKDHRANLSAGGRASAAKLTEEEARLVEGLTVELLSLGAAFAAIDIVAGRLMEVNVANPGGLATLENVYGRDPTPQAVAALMAYWARTGG
jgi:hypothetical protein